MAEEEGKRVGWLELFFDLVFVLTVTQVSALLHHDHSWAGVGRAVVAFVPVYWVWVGTTMHGNLHDLDEGRHRLGVLGLGLCGLFLALALPEAYGSRGLLFGAGYWAARSVLFALMRPTYRGVGFNPFSAGAFVSGPLLVAGGLAAGGARVGLWAAAATVDLVVPYAARRGLARVPFEPGHLSERYGLLVIIALGESVVATGVTAGRLPMTAARLVAVGLAFALVAGLWSVYFSFAAETIRSALRSAAVPIEVIRPVLPYGHLGFVGGIIAVAAAVGEVVAEPGEHLHADLAALLLGGTALYLATFGYTARRMFSSVSLAVPRLLAAAFCLALLPLAPLVPAAAALGVAAALLLTVTLVETRRATAGGTATRTAAMGS